MYGARRTIEFVVAGAVVEFVLAVPGFAQSNSSYRAMVAAERTSSVALREYVTEPQPREVMYPAGGIPPNLVAPPTYHSLLRTMLQRSSTFRRQCQRLANTPELTVHVLSATSGRADSFRARTRIVRRPEGLAATVEFLQLADAPELIAHEIEHIIEQLDGVNLAARAVMTGSGVHATNVGEVWYETERATRVGLTVAADMRRTRR